MYKEPEKEIEKTMTENAWGFNNQSQQKGKHTWQCTKENILCSVGNYE